MYVTRVWHAGLPWPGVSKTIYGLVVSFIQHHEETRKILPATKGRLHEPSVGTTILVLDYVLEDC